MYKIFHHKYCQDNIVREPSTILKYKVIQAQRVWNESINLIITGEIRLRYHFLKSLILAQDERWRRA